MDLKGCVLELAQRNSQISVPFMVSSLGYGMLWNNPAVGRVTFGNNYTEWIARATKEMDYWITAADTPKQILENYTNATGHADMFPEDLMGLWQCKLRYRTQDEVLTVARQYQKEGIKIDQIVMLPMQSLGVASMTIVGQNLGKGYFERAGKSANTAFAMCFICTLILIIHVVILAPWLVSFFNENPEIIEYGTLYTRLLTPFYLVWTVNAIYAGALRGAGRSTSTMVIMLSSFVAFRQIYLFVISQIINTPVAIALSYPLGWIIASTATIIYYKKVGLTPKEKKQIVID